MEYKWAQFLSGSAVIRISNENDFNHFKRLITANKLFYYETFVRYSFDRLLELFKLNNDCGQMCIEYLPCKGFTFSGSIEYQKSEYEIFDFEEIRNELDK